jgi:hypothetical protein
VGDDVIAERLDLQPRERLVDAFDFLQADDVRRALLEPGQEMVEPLPDRIDVPGGYTHEWGIRGWSLSGKSRVFRARSGSSNYTFSGSGIPCAGRL